MHRWILSNFLHTKIVHFQLTHISAPHIEKILLHQFSKKLESNSVQKALFPVNMWYYFSLSLIWSYILYFSWGYFCLFQIRSEARYIAMFYSEAGVAQILVHLSAISNLHTIKEILASMGKGITGLCNLAAGGCISQPDLQLPRQRFLCCSELHQHPHHGLLQHRGLCLCSSVLPSEVG